MKLTEEELRETRTRLRRIEGQIKGIIKMLEERECAEVLIQIAAARSALAKVAHLVIQGYTRECIAGLKSGQMREEEVEELLRSYLTLV